MVSNSQTNDATTDAQQTDQHLEMLSMLTPGTRLLMQGEIDDALEDAKRQLSRETSPEGREIVNKQIEISTNWLNLLEQAEREADLK
jgi:hypothetical protein